MTKKSWKDIHPTTRKIIIAGGTLDAILKVAALVDLAKRPKEEVHGKKWQWLAGITLINAFGAAPLSYFACHGGIKCPVCKGGDCKCGVCPGKSCHKG